MQGCDSLLEGLTEAQQEAVSAPPGPMLVLAGPGSGKTTVVTRKIAALLGQGAAPWSVLALTFTNKAAAAMRDRVRVLMDGADVRGLTISTFHAFAAGQLRRLGERAGVHEDFSIWDTADQKAAMKQAIVDAGLSTGNWTPPSVLSTVSHWKNRLGTVADLEAAGDDFYTRNLARAWRAYNRILSEARALDFDDLLLKFAVALRDDESLRREFSSRWTNLLVDEYQDTNHAQFVIAASIASGHGNICVVGDPDQSIYAWRGADIGNILEFESKWAGARVVNLGTNFRSTGRIVAAAAGLIENNTTHRKREHVAAGELGDPVVLMRVQDEHDEASDIVERLRAHHEEDGVPWSEMAVLYRMNALSRVLEEAFRDANIPHVVARGTAFYDRKEIRDALSMLRVVLNPRDDVAFRRIVNTPPRGIGATTMDLVERRAAKNRVSLLEAMDSLLESGELATRARKAVTAFTQLIAAWRQELETASPDADMAAFVAAVIAQSGLEAHLKGAGEEEQERLENLEELISAAVDRDADTSASYDEAELPPLRRRLASWLESIALIADADAVDPEQGAVTLMTLHAAKGLEFDVVAIVALEQGILPHARSNTDPAQMEEERRLCYVGMTRARRHLMLTRAMVRTQRGIRERTAGSCFLEEVPATEVRHIEPEPIWGSAADEVPIFKSEHDPGGVVRGAYVRHPRFGVGQVQRVLQRPQGTTATINFQEWGPRTLYVSRTSLEVIDPEDLL
ncbi:MAG: UvrD-helicase domain-containing protein [Phycisphaerales bacterium]|nr:UvrD-helicase domain-containing protein [Phycisphaerales bacterium]